ncbi:MAG: AsmA family protein, partial [Alphaproteobacteria bacterium]
RLTGAARLGLTGAGTIDADLVVDRINLDAYMATAKATKAATPTSAAAPLTAPSRPKSGKPKPGDPLAVLASFNALKTLDARLKAQIKTLVYKGAPIKNIVLDGKIADNTLSLNTLSVAKMAGARIKASGVVSSLVGVPDLKNVRLDVATGDVARLLRMAGVKAPIDSRKMGAVSVQVRADGSLLRPLVDATIKGAGGSVRAKGKVSLLPVFDGFDGNLTVKHKNLAALVRAFGVAYRPAGNLGSVDFQAALKARASGMDLADIKAKLGPVNMSGTAKVGLDGPRPKLTAVLKTGEIVIDKFLPATGKASLPGRGGFVPATFDGVSSPLAEPAFRRMAALSSGRWSTKPLDFSALKSFDADVKLLSDALVYDKYRIARADLAATVSGGVLQVERFKGGLFGGAIDARGTIRAANPSSFSTAVSLGNLNVAEALLAATGKRLAKGQAALELRLSSAGYTLSDMIAALSGNGSVAMNKLDVKSGAVGTPMAAAFGLISGLNDLGGVLSGKKAGGALADITGTFTIDKGVVRSNDLTLNSGIGNGRASGSADLARWMVDLTGEVTMSQSFLGKMLNGGGQATQRLPFSVSGRLDSPNVKLDTSKLQAAGIIPGLDKVLGKSKIGNVLQQIIPGLGGATQRQPQPTQPPSTGDTPPPPPPEEPKKIKPADLLKGILKGFGR